uniref:Uncharacterized protein n=1 Tax=Clytia hemisphaerica TaxID=252671 RepID=A0A7M5VDJ7_9CNID
MDEKNNGVTLTEQQKADDYFTLPGVNRPINPTDPLNLREVHFVEKALWKLEETKKRQRSNDDEDGKSCHNKLMRGQSNESLSRVPRGIYTSYADAVRGNTYWNGNNYQQYQTAHLPNRLSMTEKPYWYDMPCTNYY